MKISIAGFILIFFIFSTLGISCAKSLEMKSRTGEYVVEIELERNPPITGDNEIEIFIKDARGQLIGNQTVLVNYYMLPMPRMAPMNYTVSTKIYKNGYRTDLKFIMSGPWIIAVKIVNQKNTKTVKFNIDVQ